jgi:murein DD-endopeptidase MepM/ murein hydrolase activator NlpD
MVRFLRLPLSFVLVLTAACSSVPDRPAAVQGQDVVLPRDRNTIEGRVPRAATLETLLRQYQVDPAIISPLTTAVREVFNPRELRADRSFTLTKTLDGLFREFRYDKDAESFLRVVFRDRGDNGQPAFDVSVVPYPREISVEVAAAEITKEQPSLFAAFDAVGESAQLPLDFADVFSGEIDFNSEMQRGDTARVLFERIRREGQPAGYGALAAAVLEHDGRRFIGIPFKGSDGKVAWYDENGRSLKRQFLKSPLPFDPRVTSGFSRRRLHPVFGSYRAHLGVDYAAGIGTPVVAVSDGVVTFAAWSGQSGRLVTVRHSGGYETLYLHLSSFGPGIRPGVHVSQGQLLGRVGMSGAATGPHLDFRIKKSGDYINPLLARSRMPPGEPIPASQLAEFERVRDDALQKLQAQTPVNTLAAVQPGPRP